MRTAVLQFKPTPSDYVGNLRRLAVMIRLAARKGAKLIVLPELALSGYSFLKADEARRDSERLADFDPKTGSEATSMGVFYRIAKEYNVYIVWGLIEESGTGKLFNSQVLMCPDGAFEAYSKINLFSSDYIWATPGKVSPPIRKIVVAGETRNVGLLICRDVRDKSDSHSSLYEPGDADVVCMSAGWGLGAFPATAWMSFAANNKVSLAVANRYGKDVPNDFGHGGVCIVHADQSVDCEGIVWDEPCIVYGEV